MSKSISRRTLLSAATATVLAMAIAPLAVSRGDSLARVDIYDRSADVALPVQRHRGRQYVAGQPGNEYAIRIRNHTGGRLLAVVSVDGVNAVTGESASPDQSGYVLEPGGTVAICDAHLFSQGPARLLNPLIEAAYRRGAAWNPGRDIAGELEALFGAVEVQTHAGGLYQIAVAHKDVS